VLLLPSEQQQELQEWLQLKLLVKKTENGSKTTENYGNL
jgi:hypothetical protein